MDRFITVGLIVTTLCLGFWILLVTTIVVVEISPDSWINTKEGLRLLIELAVFLPITFIGPVNSSLDD